jgi:hypothetical protein
MSNLGPLTTTFTPDGKSCGDSTDFYAIATKPGARYLAQGPRDLAACLPSGYEPARDAYYSPGVCPDGYTVACSQVTSAGDVTETIQTCCPTVDEYQCLTEAVRNHQKNFLCSINLNPAIGSGSWTIGPVTEVDVVNDVSTTLSRISGLGGAMNAYGVQVRFQAKDWETSSTTTTASSEESSSSSSPSGPGAFSLASTSQTSSVPLETGTSEAASDSGLSTGATAGIAVGAVVAGLFLLGMLAWLLLRRRKQNKATQAAIVDYQSVPPKPKEAYGDGNVAEMDGNTQAHRVELDGTGMGR